MSIGQTSCMPKIIIIGAGIQGLSVALALAARGIDSTILESQPNAMRGASFGNEGKIHLGFVYALDQSYQTGQEMLRGAHSFAPLLDSWCGPLPWHEWRSSGFRYAVMPGSLASPDELENYYEQLRIRIPESLESLPVRPSYFGQDISWMWERARTHTGSPFVNGHFAPCFDTEEISIDVRMFSDALLKKVNDSPHIALCTNSRVNTAKRSGNTFTLDLESCCKMNTIDADIVINCAWMDRARLDRLVSGETQQDSCLSYRIKHGVIVRPRTSHSLRPVTMVQGPYGDVTPFKDGTVFLSWYPECRTYFNQSPPTSELDDTRTLGEIASRTLNKMSEMFPDLENAEIVSCKPGIIVAEGSSDVDDPGSKLHQRAISGPSGGNGWWSVDTGKLTLAPLHAHTTVQLILKELSIGKTAA